MEAKVKIAKASKSFDFLAVGDWSPGEFKVTSDYSVGHLLLNLEGPVLSGSHEILQRISKVGPHLSSKALPKFAKFIIASLANNHIMDFGVNGAIQTEEAIARENGISGGFGKSLNQSREPKIFKYKQKSVGLLSVAEDQFGRATLREGGYATVGPWLYAEVKSLKQTVDLVIVTIHGGLEMSNFPSPYRVEICRTLARLGADFVLCHHPHVPQGWESYEDSFIAYGLGNYCTDPTAIDHAGSGKFSLGIELDCTKPAESKVHLLRQTHKGENEILLQVNNSLGRLIDELREKLCEPLGDTNLLSALWRASLIPNYDRYYLQDVESARNFSQTVFYGILKIKHRLEGNRNKLENQKLMKLKHFFSTESHRELIADTLSIKSGILPCENLPNILDVDSEIEKLWEAIQKEIDFDNR
jgi:hypothetical protein